MHIKEAAEAHYAWLKQMGWCNTTPLESLALITSEIGEAVNECRGEVPTDKLGTELADIVLRTFGLAERLSIDIETEIRKKMDINASRGTRGRIK